MAKWKSDEWSLVPSRIVDAQKDVKHTLPHPTQPPVEKENWIEPN